MHIWIEVCLSACTDAHLQIDQHEPLAPQYSPQSSVSQSIASFCRWQLRYLKGRLAGVSKPVPAAGDRKKEQVTGRCSIRSEVLACDQVPARVCDACARLCVCFVLCLCVRLIKIPGTRWPFLRWSLLAATRAESNNAVRVSDFVSYPGRNLYTTIMMIDY